MGVPFDVSPETRASTWHYFYRQLFVTPPPVTRRDADLSGKTVIITGANGGLGIDTARQILALGAKVILAVRSEAKGEKIRQELLNECKLIPDLIQVWELDLMSYNSVISFAKRAKSLEHLDIAILNAGVFKVTESFGPTNYEESVQINYLSTVLLTVLLLPVIIEKKTPGGPGRICIVSSDAAAWAKFQERASDPLLGAFTQKAAKWGFYDRYATTKLLGQLFLVELAKQVSRTVVTVDAANPGFCAGSDLAREASGIFRFIYRIQCGLLARTCSVGARTFIHAISTLGEEAHGHYIEDAKIQPMPPIVYTPEGQQIAKKLYEETLDELSFAGRMTWLVWQVLGIQFMETLYGVLGTVGNKTLDIAGGTYQVAAFPVQPEPAQYLMTQFWPAGLSLVPLCMIRSTKILTAMALEALFRDEPSCLPFC
ncbi:NAD(P)-binding protein [Thozetella sp. PMI_491]|nr:NAD(P)-binding protein [Thozetella sp. PMI_491]